MSSTSSLVKLVSRWQVTVMMIRVDVHNVKMRWQRRRIYLVTKAAYAGRIYVFYTGRLPERSRDHAGFLWQILYMLPKNVAYCYMEKLQMISKLDKNSSWDEIANLNFYAVCPEATWIRWNNAIMPFKVIQGHRFWYQSKVHNYTILRPTSYLAPFPRCSRR